LPRPTRRRGMLDDPCPRRSRSPQPRRGCGDASPSTAQGVTRTVVATTEYRAVSRLRNALADFLSELPAFGFVQAAPDAVRLANRQREVETVATNRTRRTDGLGPPFAILALVATLHVRRWEEESRLGSSARGSQLPGVVHGSDAHRTPLGWARRGQAIPARVARQGAISDLAGTTADQCG
jgi:hypothetical protein